MRTITLTDGAVYAVTMCGEADGYLWITTPDIVSLTDAVAVFIPEKTEKITHKFGENDTVTYEGYTELTQAMLRDGTVTVCLHKGV